MEKQSDRPPQWMKLLSRQLIQNQALIDQVDALFQSQVHEGGPSIDVACRFLLDGNDTDEDFLVRLKLLTTQFGEHYFTQFIRVLVAYRTIMAVNNQAQHAIDTLENDR